MGADRNDILLISHESSPSSLLLDPHKLCTQYDGTQKAGSFLAFELEKIFGEKPMEPAMPSVPRPAALLLTTVPGPVADVPVKASSFAPLST